MTAHPISITIMIGDVKGEWALVADPRDGLTAMQIGRHVSTFLLEFAPIADAGSEGS